MGDDILLNCVLGVCCEPADAEAALATFMAEQTGLSPEDASKAAGCICSHFDLAEKGTLGTFKASVARLARGPQGKRGRV